MIGFAAIVYKLLVKCSFVGLGPGGLSTVQARRLFGLGTDYSVAQVYTRLSV